MTKFFDHIIIGAGAAGLHLAMAIIEDGSFKNQTFLIIDRDAKEANDRTWSYWETGRGKWDNISAGQWEKGVFIDSSGTKSLEMGGYQYKTVRSKEFYAKAKNLILSAGNFKWLQGEVKSVSGTNPIDISTSKGNFTAQNVFDSRIDDSFSNIEDGHIRILQHFKGWIIETKENIFDPDVFIMMDFRHRWKETTSFIYVLPYSQNKALVEFTFFSPDLVDQHVYDNMLRKYIDEYLVIADYEILEEEYGVIPMTSFPFQKFHRPGISKIGTAGGWVKPSSGYSFKNAERNALKMVHNLKNNKSPHQGIATNFHRKYDLLFLDILYQNNALGPELFSSMYQNLPTHLIFKFLDEQTTLSEDIKVVSAFRAHPFLKALFRQFKKII